MGRNFYLVHQVLPIVFQLLLECLGPCSRDVVFDGEGTPTFAGGRHDVLQNNIAFGPAAGD